MTTTDSTYSLTKSGYYADFVTVPFATAVAVFWLLSANTFVPLLFANGLLAGLFSWTFLEYATHRWILHRTHAREHRFHHIFPEEFIGVSPVTTAVIGAFSFWFLTTFFGPNLGVGLLVGLVTGYMAYLYVHDRVHHSMIRGGGYLADLNRNHAYHHDRFRVNFGVITPAWDIIFGTYQKNPAKPLNEI